MTQDEVLNLARQADGQVTMWVNHSTIQKTTTFTFESPIDYYVSGEYPEKYHRKFLEAFAQLVAAKALAQEKALQALHSENERLGLYKDAYAQPEPVAWMDADGNVSDNNDHKCFPIPLYTTPPQRTWVGLTNDEQQQAYEQWQNDGWGVFYNAIEAKLKEKNT